jgi:excisionase family DNA binding protein
VLGQCPRGKAYPEAHAIRTSPTPFAGTELPGPGLDARLGVSHRDTGVSDILEQRMSANLSNPEELLTPSEVAALFRVDPKTVTRWAKAGKLSCVKTLGGHRRYLASEVNALLEGLPIQRSPQQG